MRVKLVKALTIFVVYFIDIYFDRKDIVNVKEYLQARKECKEGGAERETFK